MSCLRDPDDEYLTEHAYTEARAKADRAETRVRILIAAPLSRVRALAVAAIVVRGLTDEGERIGRMNDWAIQMVRTMVGIARRQASIPPTTVEERLTLDRATATIHKLVVQDCERKGIAVARCRQHARAS